MLMILGGILVKTRAFVKAGEGERFHRATRQNSRLIERKKERKKNEPKWRRLDKTKQHKLEKKQTKTIENGVPN